MAYTPTVLILDDDVDLLEMVGIVLRSYKMGVHCITDSALLFKSIAETDPGLILMDIFLGDLDGRLLCKQLKSSEQYRHIPVILYSAGHITHNSILDSQADEFIIKPFDINVLAKKIQGLLNNDRISNVQ